MRLTDQPSADLKLLEAEARAHEVVGAYLADVSLQDGKPEIYMTMLETAETVAERYGISREAQDAYAVQSQQRTAAAQAAGLFQDEIEPMPSVVLTW